jgi:hypothetical protein
MRIREVWGKEEKIDINSGKYFNREEEIVGLDPPRCLKAATRPLVVFYMLRWISRYLLRFCCII